MYHVLENYFKNKERRQKNYITEIMSKVPDDLNNQESVRKDMAILRAAIIAELDASNLYEQFLHQATNEDVKKLLLDLSNEEKVHVGELQYLLEKIDPDYSEMFEEGKDEAEEKTK